MSLRTPQDEDAVLVYVTVPSEAEAERLGKEVVRRRLAACANIVPAIRSIYWWDGAMVDDAEALLLLKTRATLTAQLRETIVALHPYEVPAISTIPLLHVHEPYLQWLLHETQDS